MAYRLALALGIWDVTGWLDVMPASQLTLWEAYAAVEPFGDVMDDLRMARLMALTANINRDTRRQTRPYSPVDFMLSPSPSTSSGTGSGYGRLSRSEEAVRQDMLTWALAHNAGYQN